MVNMQGYFEPYSRWALLYQCITTLLSMVWCRRALEPTANRHCCFEVLPPCWWWLFYRSTLNLHPVGAAPLVYCHLAVYGYGADIVWNLQSVTHCSIGVLSPCCADVVLNRRSVTAPLMHCHLTVYGYGADVVSNLQSVDTALCMYCLPAMYSYTTEVIYLVSWCFMPVNHKGLYQGWRRLS